VSAVVNQVVGAQRDAAGNLKGKPKMPPMRQHLNLWERYGTTDEMLAPLADFAQLLLRAHVMSAATERDWSLWGRVYNASRSQLGRERAK
jgi:hypothetical protein